MLDVWWALYPSIYCKFLRECSSKSIIKDSQYLLNKLIIMDKKMKSQFESRCRPVHKYVKSKKNEKIQTNASTGNANYAMHR